MIPTFIASRATKYTTKGGYRSHIRCIHKIELPPLPNNGPIYDPNMKEVDENDANNTSCFFCKLVFKTRKHYLRYVSLHRKKGLLNSRMSTPKEKPLINPNIVPDLNDPNGYCASCNKTIKNLRAYKNHIRLKHGVGKYSQPKPNSDIVPDTSDPTNKYCASCQHKYPNRQDYIRHVWNIHGIKAESNGTFTLKRRIDSNLTIKPDIHNPNDFCKLCARKYSSRYAYIGHLEIVHNVVFEKRITEAGRQFRSIRKKRSNWQVYQMHQILFIKEVYLL